MKKFEYIISAVIMILMLMISLRMSAQDVKREGMTFKQVSSSSRGSKADTLLTSFKFEDSKGTLYPIIVNKQSGRCWIWRKSSKTGKMYKSYIAEDIAKQVCQELGINYIPKKAK